MKYGLDMLYPPSPWQAEAMVELGWTWLNVYVGGPRAAAREGWRQVDGLYYPVRDVADIFEGFLPTYVGRNYPWDAAPVLNYQQGRFDGADANRCTGACGFDKDSILCLDMEYGTWQFDPEGANEYIRGWVEVVNAAGHPAVLYSDIETLNHVQYGELIDFKWGAAWVRGQTFLGAPEGQFDPQSPPPWDAWQFGGGYIAGVACDCNSATDTFPLAHYG